MGKKCMVCILAAMCILVASAPSCAAKSLATSETTASTEPSTSSIAATEPQDMPAPCPEIVASLQDIPLTTVGREIIR